MQVKIDNDYYQVNIIRKPGQRHTYLRVKKDLQIYVTTNKLTSLKEIQRVIDSNFEALMKLVLKAKEKSAKIDRFIFLGRNYDIIYTNTKEIILGDNKVFMIKGMNLDKWFLEQAKVIFLRHLDDVYHNYKGSIPYPKLRIRKMTSRWGVCNYREKIITLNLELIKMDTKYLDYVIVHELSHFLYPNHSKEFWFEVAKNCSNFKQLRSEMRKE